MLNIYIKFYLLNYSTKLVLPNLILWEGYIVMINEVRPYIELMYFLSGIILVGTVIIGLYQIKLLKNDIETNNYRYIIGKTIEFMDRFSGTITPIIDDYIKCLHQKELKIYDGVIHDNFKDDVYVIKNIELIKIKASAGGIKLANELEVMAAAIISGLTDENLSFQSFSRAYCLAVESIYDVLCFCRSGNQNEIYANSIKLHKMWKAKIIVDELGVFRYHNVATNQ